MDNRELAQALLCEASDLLSESYGAHGAATKFYDERIKKSEKFIKDNQRKADMYKRAGYEDKGPSKAIEDAKYDIDYSKREKAIYDTKNPKRNTSDRKKAANYSATFAGHDYDYGHAANNGTNKKELSYRQKELHNRINKRAKAQNESIAVLLTEAALLLNESVGVKDKSTDKVVKVFNTNKEATDWIINNGGTEKYQLTNKLK